MPEKETVDRANQDLREGKSPSTAAGEFVREEMDHIREGKHGASSPQQAIAIGLSKARRAGIPLKPQGKDGAGQKSEERDYRKGQSGGRKKTSARRSRASRAALKRKPRTAASHAALSRQAKSAAKKRGATSRKKSASKAARTRQRRAA